MSTKIFVDGSCRGNPGPGGWAALIIRGTNETLITGSEVNTTNNRMELLAAVNALEMLREKETAVLYSDSQYVVNGMNAWIEQWRKHDWKTTTGRTKNIDLWQRLYVLSQKHTPKFIWMGAHTTDEMERVDELAKKSSEEVML